MRPILRSSLACIAVLATACSSSVQPETPIHIGDGGMGDQKDGATTADTGKRPDSKTGDDAGGGGGPPEGGSTCNLVRIVPPILTVTDSMTGKAICDATATAGDGGVAGLSACDAGEGCTGQCQYTVNGLNGSSALQISVTAPDYSSSTVMVMDGYCGCDQSICAPAQQVMVTLEHREGKDAAPPPARGCPTGAPSQGSSCAVSGLYCDYGSSLNPYCNDLWECSGSRWENMSTGGICPPPSATCPASYHAASANLACTQTDESELCQYPQGTCICTQDPGGLPHTGGPAWACNPVTAGCPATIPTLGSACPPDMPTDCDYGQCSGGPGLTCVQGYWTLASVACEG